MSEIHEKFDATKYRYDYAIYNIIVVVIIILLIYFCLALTPIALVCIIIVFCLLCFSFPQIIIIQNSE